MKLTIAEKIGLIYSASGSQRKVASVLGISHQTVGRILHKGINGESLARYESRPDIIKAINRGFSSHVTLAKAVAKRDGIPFNAALPVYTEKMKRSDGKPSDRTISPHTHWLSDRVRNAWIKSSQRSEKYVGVTVRSRVNLREYNKRARARQRATGRPILPEHAFYKAQIEKRIKESGSIGSIFTSYTDMRNPALVDITIADLNDKLRARHQPATGEAGTAYADQIIMQMSKRNRSNAKPDKARDTKPGKARGNKAPRR